MRDVSVVVEVSGGNAFGIDEILAELLCGSVRARLAQCWLVCRPWWGGGGTECWPPVPP